MDICSDMMKVLLMLIMVSYVISQVEAQTTNLSKKPSQGDLMKKIRKLSESMKKMKNETQQLRSELEDVKRECGCRKHEDIFIFGYWSPRYGIINSIVKEKLLIHTAETESKFLSHELLKVVTSEENMSLYTNYLPRGSNSDLSELREATQSFSSAIEKSAKRKVILYVGLLLWHDGTFRELHGKHHQRQMNLLNQYIEENKNKPFNLVVRLEKRDTAGNQDNSYKHNEKDRQLVLEELSRRLPKVPSQTLSETLIVDRKDWLDAYFPNEFGRDKIQSFISQCPTF